MAMPLTVRTPRGAIEAAADPAWMIGAGASVLLFAIALFDHRVLNDGDTYWHLAAGNWILDHARIPYTDPFSFTRNGAPWHAHEWLAEVITALAFRLGRWNGVVTLYGIALAGAVLALNNRLRRSLSGASLAVVLTLALTCVAPDLLARPHILVLPILIAWTAELLQAREAQRAPRLWFAGLMLAWANLHGSFVLGFLLLAGFALEAVWDSPADERWKVSRAWAIFSLLALCAATITPEGPMGLIFPFKLMTMSALSGVGEWRPLDFSKLQPFEIALAATLYVGLTRGMKVPPVRLLLLIGLLHMAFQHTRHAMVAALVGAMVLAAPLAEALGQAKPEAKRAGVGAWLGFALVALALIAGRAAMPLIRSDDAVTPGAALDHVPAALRAEPVLNEYGFGGYLIFRGVKPYIDSRADLYGDTFLIHYSQIIRPDAAALAQTLRDARIAWTIMPPASPVVALMDARPDWRRLYADRFAVIHVRTEAMRKAQGRIPW